MTLIRIRGRGKGEKNERKRDISDRSIEREGKEKRLWKYVNEGKEVG